MVAPKAPRLDTQTVVAAALDLLNDVGLDGLTLRAIAARLRVKAPALYWHFENKQALLDEMATEMYRRMVAGQRSASRETWQERLLASSRVLRAALLRYRDGAKVFSGSRFTGTDHAAEMEVTLRLLVDAGFTMAQAVRAAATVYLFTIGFVTEEQGVEPVSGRPRPGFDVKARAQRMAAFPLSAAAGAEIFGRYDEHFEESLLLVIAGIEARYVRPRPAASARGRGTRRR